jgi:plastocyanin
MIVVGIALRDKEAVAIGVGLGAGAGLLSFRGGQLGRVLLLLLGLDVLAWMGTAAVANVADGEDFVAVVVPLLLSVAAALTAAAAVCDLLRRRGRHVGDRRAALTTAAAGVLVFVAGLGVAQLGLFGSPVAAHPGDIVLAMKDAKFATERITVPAGRITVLVDNKDLFWHTFTVDALHVDARVPVKARRRVTFTVPGPGTYTYYCAIPGHRAIGMEGTLTVTP